MPLFCKDRDFLNWDPAVFSEPTVAHLALVRDADATLDGVNLTTAVTLIGIEPGMVALLSQGTGDDLMTTAVEITAVPEAGEATVSVLRADVEAAAIAPAMQGAVKLTIVSLKPVIKAVGEEVTTLLGVPNDTELPEVRGVRPAVIYGTLTAVYRAAGPTPMADAKLALFTRLYQIARRSVTGAVDLDEDGFAETNVAAGVTMLQRV